MERRKKIYEKQHVHKEENLFKSLIKCGTCGCTYQRKMNYKKFVWVCSTYSTQGRAACSSMNVPESAIVEGLEFIFSTNKINKKLLNENIKSIVVQPDKLLIYELKNGDKKEIIWIYKSRALSWTDEMKKEAGKRTKEAKEVKLCQR